MEEKKLAQISRSSSSSFSPGCPEPVKALGETTLLFESARLSGNLTIEQAAGHGDEHECGIGGDFGVCGRGGRGGRYGRCGRYGLSTTSTKSMASTWSNLSIMLFFYPLRHLIGSGAPPGNQLRPTRVFLRPYH